MPIINGKACVANGRNLLTGTSDFSSNWSAWPGKLSISKTTEYNGHPSLEFASSSDINYALQYNVGAKKSSKYTSSFWAKADNVGDKAHTELYGSIGATNFVLTTNWVHYSAVLTSGPDVIEDTIYYIGVPGGNKGNVYIAFPKLEKGSVATPLTPAPVDKVFSDGRQVYGRNLLSNSNFSSGLDNWTVNLGGNSDCKTVVTTDSDGDACVHITGTGYGCGIYTQSVPFNQNQITTGSVLVKGTGTLLWVGLESRASSEFGTISTESYSKVGSTMQAASRTNPFCIYFRPASGVVDVYIKFAKLEKGSLATPWTPAPEDVM